MDFLSNDNSITGEKYNENSNSILESPSKRKILLLTN